MKKLLWALSLLVFILAALIFWSGLPSKEPLRYQREWTLSPLDSLINRTYRIEKIELPDDYEGKVSATLLCKPAPQAGNKAVLHIHGWADYFFHDHLAQWYQARGYDFYALELRKYGRSLRPEQKPNYCRDLHEYFPELDEALLRITERDSNTQVLLNCHSTGGLTAALYAHEGKRRADIDGLVLNSPFLTFDAKGAMGAAINFYAFLGRFNHKAVLPISGSPLYGYTIHKEHQGRFDFNYAWKPEIGYPFYQSWANAILQGHKQVDQGLQVKCPVLVLCSDKSYQGQDLEPAKRADVVLSVSGIQRQAKKLGKQVEISVVPGAVHDVFLSQEEVMQAAFAKMEGWMKKRFGE
jgi:alpha-beta hydrolase superfamily lysophospholipase